MATETRIEDRECASQAGQIANDGFSQPCKRLATGHAERRLWGMKTRSRGHGRAAGVGFESESAAVDDDEGGCRGRLLAGSQLIAIAGDETPQGVSHLRDHTNPVARGWLAKLAELRIPWAVVTVQ
jgi:hypothetical protein